MPRYIPPQVFNALSSENVGTIHELYEFDLPSGTRYWARAKYTYRGQVYTPLVRDRGDIRTSAKPENDGLKVSLINVDGTIRGLMDDDEFLDSECRVRLIVEGLADSTTPVFSGTVSTRTCVASGIGTEVRDGLWTFTWLSAFSWWTASYTRHDGKVFTFPTFGGTSGGVFTAAVASSAITVTITGTYGAGQNLNTWTLRTTNNFLLFAGIAENPVEAGEDDVEISVHGMTELLMAPVPRRNFQRPCGWMFGPVAAALGKATPCGYTGPTSTAVGAGVASTDLTVASGADFVSSKGSSIQIGDGAAVVITNVVGAAITLASARTWSNADAVVFTDCRKYFGDCQDRNREFEFGGFRGIRTTKGIISKRIVRIHESNHNPGLGAWVVGGAHGLAIDPVAPALYINSQNTSSQTAELIRSQRIEFPVPDHDDPIPIVYGRRVVSGIPIEFFSFDDDGARGWRTGFYAISGGPLPDTAEPGAIDAAWVAGKRKKHSVQTISGDEVLRHGFFTRRGVPAVADGETNAEYNTDSTSQKRSQNIDYQGGTGTAYGYLAYAIFRTKRNSDLWGGSDSDKDVPEGLFRVVEGKEVQAYDEDGTADGAAAFSQNPIWQMLDLLTDVTDGAGIPASRFSYRRLKLAADYCDALIDSVEADTVATAGSSGTTVLVKTTAGFKFKETLYLNGVSTGFTIEDVPNGTQIELSAALVVVSGDRIHQKNARFQSDIRIGRRDKASKVLEQILFGCRGYLTQQDGELAFDIDRPLAAELLTDGGFELWSSSTNLTNWIEDLSGTSTINREATIVRTGTYSVRMAIDSSNNATEISFSLGVLTPGTVWVARVVSQAASWVGGESVKIKIKNTAGAGTYLQADGTWAATAVYIDLPLKATSWQDLFYIFRVDPYVGGSAHELYIKSGTGLSSRNLYLDDASVYGPVGGEYRDLGHSLLSQRCFILEGKDSFRQGPANPQREINEVKVSFSGSLGGTAYKPEDDGVQVRNETHQATHVRKEQTVDAPSLSTPDQAVRIAKYGLNRARTLKEGARFRTLFSGLLPLPGDVILLSHRAPAWERRLHRVTTVAIENDYRVEIECEHYDPTVYTDAGERSELGISAGLPTILLSVDAAKTKRLELSWIPSVGSAPIDRYEVYVGTTSIDPDDPSSDDFQGPTKKTSFNYHVPHSERSTTLYARVVGILHNGEFAVSNEVSTANSLDTLDDIADGDTRTLVHVPHNFIKNGDFSDTAKWTKAAHGGTATVASDVGNLNATGHTGSLFPTIYRAFPGNGKNDSIPFPANSWISVAISARYSGLAATSDLIVFLFSGAEVGDGSETNFTEILRIAAADIDPVFARFVTQFQFGAAAPGAPAGGTAYRVGIRGFSTTNLRFDKIQLLPGKVDLSSVGYRNHVDDEANGDEYGDFTEPDGASGGGNYGGGLFTPPGGGGGGKYPDIR